jgi:soluble lytic murein transglycosylase-like protein
MKQAEPQRPLPSAIAAIADSIAARHGMPPELIRAVIWVESRGQPKARSPKGAVGLMQLMPLTAAGLGVADSTDAQENVDGGTRYLKSLVKKYDGDERLALAAYNWGPANVDGSIRTAGNPAAAMQLIPRGVQSYVASVQQRRMAEPMDETKGPHAVVPPFRSSVLPLQLSCPSCSHAFAVALEVAVKESNDT